MYFTANGDGEGEGVLLEVALPDGVIDLAAA
jgi:hypothetical protein